MQDLQAKDKTQKMQRRSHENTVQFKAGKQSLSLSHELFWLYVLLSTKTFALGVPFPTLLRCWLTSSRSQCHMPGTRSPTAHRHSLKSSRLPWVLNPMRWEGCEWWLKIGKLKSEILICSHKRQTYVSMLFRTLTSCRLKSRSHVSKAKLHSRETVWVGFQWTN